MSKNNYSDPAFRRRLQYILKCSRRSAFTQRRAQLDKSSLMGFVCVRVCCLLWLIPPEPSPAALSVLACMCLLPTISALSSNRSITLQTHRFHRPPWWNTQQVCHVLEMAISPPIHNVHRPLGPCGDRAAAAVLTEWRVVYVIEIYYSFIPVR